MVRCVIGIEIVKEGKGAKVEGEAKKGSVVCIQHAVGEGVGLPSCYCLCVATNYGAVETV